MLIGLSPLLLFKYYNFINDSITDLLFSLGIGINIPGLNWAVPIGISFYTFQAIGYLIQVNKKQIVAEHNVLDYCLFISFFPQVISGPISKSNELLPQIKNPKPFEGDLAFHGVRQLVWGLFVKLVIADRLGMCVDSIVFQYYRYSGITCLAGSIFYSLQIYCDFMGYSYIAMGVAKLFGFKLINNFQQPYFSISITDFWHRWHISLSRWLKENIYFSLGGSRCSKSRNYLNIFITFLVSGLWHGANWTFVIWGCLHGIFQIIEKMLGLQTLYKKNLFIRFCRIALTFLIVNFLWILFRMPTIELTYDYVLHTFTTGGAFDMGATGLTSIFIICLSLPVLFIKDLRAEKSIRCLKFLDKGWAMIASTVILISLILSVGVLDSSTFIYASF